jgi:anti-sigma-K factor RskA
VNSEPDNNAASDLEAQLAEYALGVLEPALASELERGLAECRDRLLLAQQYNQVVGMLGYAVNPAEPPEGHKSRFMARLSTTGQVPAAEVSGAGAPRPLSTGTLPPTPAGVAPQAAASGPSLVIDLAQERARRRSQFALPLIATVAAALVILAGVWGLSLKGSSDATNARLDKIRTALKTAPPGSVAFLVEGQAPSPNSWAFCLVNPRTNQATLVANDLSTLPASQVYEMWWLPQQKDKAPVAAGVFNTDASGAASHSASAPDPLSTYAGVAVSIEPAPGETHNSGPIVLAGTYTLP